MSETDHIGPYELRGELGRGAMARVWRAWDPNLEREVAIKEPLFDSHLSDEVLEEMARRFVKEGRTAANLKHPGIVSIYAADVYDGRPAIVMELIEGVTLGELLEKGALGAEPTLDALDQLLDAVGYAHGKGVVHRDIKPDNIFVDQEGHIKLSDFGIAHVDDASATKATIAGSVLGTPGYMAPEQATGATVDSRTDLFSIGVVGYEMLSGRNPFGAGDGSDSTTLIYRIVHEPAPELPASVDADLPADMRPAIMAALNKDPNDRPQSAAAFKAMLHGDAAVPAAGTGSTLGASVAATAARKQGGSPKWLPYVIAGAACVVALAIVFGIFSAGGSGGGTVASNAPTATETTVATTAESPVYIGESDGKVAIFTNSSAEPYEVSGVLVSSLAESDRTAINDHIGFATIEEAEASVRELEDALAAATKAAEAESSASKSSSSGSSSGQSSVHEPSSVVLTLTGEDGVTRSETVRLQGNTGRVIPDSTTRPLTQSEIDALTDAEKCLAWNEIIAAEEGYMFINRSLNKHFTERSWYVPNPDGKSYCDPGVAADNIEKLQNSLSDQWWLYIKSP